MKPVRRILVGIKDPRARSFPAVEKAARLAEAFGAELALFHAIDVPVAAEPYLYAGTGFTKLENDIRKAHLKRVEKLAARLRRRKLKVRADVDWDYPIHEALVRHARKIKANLVVVEAHAGRRLAPWLLHLTDFELLRTSPLPVLVVKSARAWRRPKLLAAVDPMHTFAKPAGLDAVIMDAGASFSRALGGQLHAMHAYAPVATGVSPFIGESAETVAEVLERTERFASRDFERVAEKGKVPRSRRHWVKAPPVDAIPQMARKLGAQIVVMGAVSRSALRRVVIGNTAERILGDLECDVLVVKPPRFVTRVSPRRRGVRYTVSAEAPVTF